MSPIMSSQLITKKHYNIHGLPPCIVLFIRVSVFISFYFLQQGPQITEMVIMMMEMVIGEQCNNAWKSFISHYLISYRPSYAAHTCGPATGIYILVWVWFIYIGMSSLTTIIPFVEVFEFCVFLPLSPQSLAKSVIPGKANRIKAIDKYAKISLMVI